MTSIHRWELEKEKQQLSPLQGSRSKLFDKESKRHQLLKLSKRKVIHKLFKSVAAEPTPREVQAEESEFMPFGCPQTAQIRIEARKS